MRILVFLFSALMASSSTYKIQQEDLNQRVSIPKNPLKKKKIYIKKYNYESKIKSLMKKMTLKQKVGQLLMLSFTGIDDTNAKHLIDTINPGGFILFSYNISKSKKGKFILQNTLSKIRESAINKTYIPPFISVDQEGGKILRLRGIATAISSSMSLGATKSPKLAYEIGKLVGTELYALGINFNLAPVLDTNKNPKNKIIGVRSFSDDYNIVKNLGSAYIRGLQSKNVLATAKHFPGHGETVADSHYQIPILRKTAMKLSKEDWLPFKQAISDDVASVMIGHISIPNIDSSSKIATFSKKLISYYLKKKLAFKGLVISDDMMMLPVGGDPLLSSIKAINAGMDMLILSGNTKSKQKIYFGLLDAVRQGKIKRSRINDALYRVLKAKFKHKIFKQDQNITALKQVGSARNYRIAELTAERSLTIVKGLGFVKKIDDEFILLSQFRSFNFFLKKYDIDTDFVRFPLSYSFDVVDKVVALLNRSSDKVLIVTILSDWNLDILRIIKAKAPESKIIAISLDSPYFYNQVSMFVDSFICSYSYRPVSLQALAKLISKKGKNMLLGQLPVNLQKKQYNEFYGFLD